MDDAVFVCRRKSGANLPRNFQRFVRGQAADAPHQRRHILAIHKFHGQECLPISLADIEDATDVGMRNLPRHAHFAPKTRQSFFIPRQRFRQKFQRDGLPQFQIFGAIHFAHAAFA